MYTICIKRGVCLLLITFICCSPKSEMRVLLCTVWNFFCLWSARLYKNLKIWHFGIIVIGSDDVNCISLIVLRLFHQISFQGPVVQRRGHWGSQFCGFSPFLPQFFGVLHFEARFCGFLQHHGLRLLVLFHRWYTVCRCCSRFLVAL